MWSLPTWECGLKFRFSNSAGTSTQSLPTWECGLKWNKRLLWLLDRVTPYVGVWIEMCYNLLIERWRRVTPYVGVWIEILLRPLCLHPYIRHSLRGSVDWNGKCINMPKPTTCHSLRGSVDWNHFILEHAHMLAVTPYVGVWIEISHSTSNIRLIASLPTWECGLKL